MITLITAVPGSGKTLSAIAMIIKALESGRPVYTNINGLVKEKFPNNHNLHDAPSDWRDTPEGSLVIYDECQQPHLYPSDAKRGLVTDERLTAMETHRHSGHDLVFITQAPTFVHHHVRKLVGEHIHLYRGRGIGGAMRYEWSHTCDSPNDRGEQSRANSQFWKFPKEHFAYYKSATVHTHKFKVPLKLALFLFALALSIVFIISRVVASGGLASFDDSNIIKNGIAAPAQQQQPVNSQPLPFDWSNTVQESIPLGGCISSVSKCHCYTKFGVTLNISESQCRIIINNPLPRHIKLGSTKEKT
ncbi:MAG: zonular occludens toxin [Inoviridae sp.]|nr:MAG: zonular occludens toxin [Inoviridae sp.]